LIFRWIAKGVRSALAPLGLGSFVGMGPPRLCGGGIIVCRAVGPGGNGRGHIASTGLIQSLDPLVGVGYLVSAPITLEVGMRFALLLGTIWLSLGGCADSPVAESAIDVMVAADLVMDIAADGGGDTLTLDFPDGVEMIDLPQVDHGPDETVVLVDLVDWQDGGPEIEATMCNCPPPTVAMTVNGIPAPMNGSTSYINNEGVDEEFHLLLPTWDFVINLTVECPCGCPLELAQLAYEVDGELVQMVAARDALESDGNEMFVRLTEEMALLVAEELTLRAIVFDQCGEQGKAGLTVATSTRSAMVDPFDLEDPWLLVYHRDYYTVDLVEVADGAFEVSSIEAPNGRDDFLEDLWLVGLGTASPTPEFAAFECDGAVGGSECLARQLLERIRTKSHLPFFLTPEGEPGPGSVPIRFIIEGEPGAPNPADFSYQYLQGDEAEKSFSMMGFGGGDLAQNWVGMSESIDVNNTHNENNAKFGYGCFTTSLMRFFYKAIDSDPTLYALAEVALAGILPPMGGVPIGELPGDQRVIDLTYPTEELSPSEKSRRLTFDTTMDILATGLAALNVHETGHSLGLVAKGPPPGGLFGSATMASFITNPLGSKGAHIATEGPNLMEAGPGSGNNDSIDINMLLTPFFFNELNLAYLRGRVLVN
jgi:hypothetical protein